MSDPIKDGGPAFPYYGGEFEGWRGPGMTLRDYFAAHCPVEWEPIHITQAAIAQALGLDEYSKLSDIQMLEGRALVKAQTRYAYADAMLKARQR